MGKALEAKNKFEKTFCAAAVRTGVPVLRSCPGCIEDASVILEELMGDR